MNQNTRLLCFLCGLWILVMVVTKVGTVDADLSFFVFRRCRRRRFVSSVERGIWWPMDKPAAVREKMISVVYDGWGERDEHDGGRWSAVGEVDKGKESGWMWRKREC
ncbi:hypothetical protein MtrunA17_Chr2g0303961 [Medicago truncatula]|uniref:Transmembrane protein, putative n=1 Tax=Medicago truncatula TaxID=3880 RepID=G7IIV4_MEDTR|nr:transmembrane protein, putative [Medicago truncatula]RHN73930.1 hypothetical protein MtrunA17_Chr2g0303961 [Medicago truncatula]